MKSERSCAPGAADAVSHFAKFALIVGAAWAGSLAEPAYARPSGGHVVQGNVTFEHNGNYTIVRASDGSIINYLNFNILPGETVRFIQPGEWARVLNRVTGPDPSIIAGTLLSNGQVYIVNPAGVYFHNGAVVNVGGLYAAAGSLTNARFLAGVDRFTNLTGEVINDGSIKGHNINLIGDHVVNNGAISAPQGVVVMAAGDQVYLSQQGGKISVKVDGKNLTDRNYPHDGQTAPDMAATPGVENAGTINAKSGSVTLGAGDMYSLAIRNSGMINAGHGDVTIAATDGLVYNTAAGSINADVASGTAGKVTVQGPSVVNSGNISANSNSGQGGSVEVTSQNHTFLTDGSTVSAAGGSGVAKGGSVYVNSYHGLTVLAHDASVDVSGGASGGKGGTAEVSGKLLTFNGYADLSAKSGYRKGTLLLDPVNITINATGGDESFLDGNIIDFNEGGNFVFISAAALQALTGAITLQATGNISVFEPIAFVNGNDLTLEAYENIFIAAPISGVGNLVLTANYMGLGSGTGAIQIDAPIFTFGDATFSAVNTRLNSNLLSTGGNQRYLGPVDLCTDMTLTGHEVHFFSTVNATDAGLEGLTVNIDSATDGLVLGRAIFDGSVGGLRLLKNLTVNGDTDINGGLVWTKGFQRYMGATMLGDDADLKSFNAGNICFGGTLDGHANLFVETAGTTYFDGEAGKIAKLQTIFTDAPGHSQIAADMSAGTLAFGDPTSITNDVTLTGDDLVDFGQTLGGGGHDLIVRSPLTWFHGNATGFDLLQTDPNGITYIGQQQFVDGPSSGVLISGNTLDFGDDVVVLWDTTFTGLSKVDFHKTLNGAFDVVTNSNHLVHFGGNVGDTDALASLTTHVGSKSLVNQNLVIFDGTKVFVDGDINFNPEGRNSPAQVATIAARNAAGITFRSFNGSFLMGQNEKLTSLGDLNISALNGHMVLGDLNSLGDMNVMSPDIRIRTRAADSILNYLGGFDSDGGVDFVSRGAMMFSSKPTLLGSGAGPLFAVGDGKTANDKLSSFDIRTFSGLNAARFKRNNTVLDLTPPAGLPDLIDQTTGPNRINDKVVLDPIASQSLGDLAINVRPLNDGEMLGTTTGRYLQNDMFTKPPKGTPDDHTVAANRLRRTSILTSLDMHSSVYFKENVDEQTGEVTKTDQTNAVRLALGKAWKSYLERENADNNLDGAQFLAFLKDDPDQQDAYTYFNDLYTMVKNLKISGMTNNELRISLDNVLKPVRPDVLKKEQFEQLLGVTL